jgi:hypothetical protein
MDKFVIVKIYTKYPYPNGTPLEYQWEFETAREVAFFLWGRWADKYVVYKNGKYCPFTHQYPTIEDLERYLIGDIQFPALDKK